MKVLYIGVYRDGTGWGQAAIDYILALDSVGVDVVCRPLKLNGRQVKLPERILQLERKDAAGVTAVIQHVLPQHMDYCGRVDRNVGLFASETSHFRTSCWAARLNCMDEVWAINRQQADACVESGVTRPVSVVPHATDITRFQRSHEPLDQLRPYREQGEFLFYTIGEMVRRKNLAGLLRAFHTEFDPSEPVRLVVKTDLPGMPRGELERHVAAFAGEIRRGLKLHGGQAESYKDEVFLLDRLTDDAVLRLHAACDCFATASYGEAWCIPAFDAMAMGKAPIAPDWGGFSDYLTASEGWPLPCREEPVFGANDSFQDLYAGDENWASVDLLAMRKAMRQAYSNRQLLGEKARNGTERAYCFSREAVGEKMASLLTR